jgi:hypothetical protein
VKRGDLDGIVDFCAGGWRGGNRGSERDGSYWGLTQITANDQVVLLRLLLNGNAILDPASRSYALKLMAGGTVTAELSRCPEP